MRSILKVSNVYSECIYSWFYQSCIEQGGDGSSCIVCSNYQDAYTWFADWLKNYYPDNVKFFNTVINDQDSITLVSQPEECLIFTNNIHINLFAGDNIFIIEEDCPFFQSNNVLKGIKGKFE